MADITRLNPLSVSVDDVTAFILVADDDAANRAYVAHILERAGYGVVLAENGEEACTILGNQAVDLVLLDVEMPVLDGIEATRRIRMDPKFATLPILLLTGRSDHSDVVIGLDAGADDYVAKPFTPSVLLARIRSALRLRVALRGMEAAHGVVAALANAVEAKDSVTESHCQRLGTYAALLGQTIGLSTPELHAVTFGAILHDIGKIGVPESVLLKPGPLDDDEWALMRRHPEIGERICQPLNGFKAFGPIIRHHHERWDGRGYPDGLAGEATPRGARIVGVVDAFDAMTRTRVYREARSVSDAVEELRRHRGAQFDADLVDVFTRIVESGGIAAPRLQADIGDGAARILANSDLVSPGTPNRGRARVAAVPVLGDVTA